MTGWAMVYLYPLSPTAVEVKVQPNRGITCSIPEYGNGWGVVANPDGSIADTEGFLFQGRVRGHRMGRDHFGRLKAGVLYDLKVVLRL